MASLDSIAKNYFQVAQISVPGDLFYPSR
jgi:hypothetical protein